MKTFPTIKDLSIALADGAVTAQSLAADSIARADSKPADNVYLVRLDAEARAAAKDADAKRASGKAGPYTGVPITIKDNLDLKGRATTAGSKVLATAAPAEADAPVVEKLRAAGFIILGRTNMTEFAFSGLGINPHYGTPRNAAFSEHHIPGGSSSGAVVSVALGIAPAAIGTDTGGSVRIPAALCGLVGFKPTQAEVSNVGVLPLSATLDTVGVIAQTVADCQAVFDVIRDGKKTAPGPSKRSIGVVTNFVMNGVQPEVERKFNAAVEKLAKAGISVTRVQIPILDQIPEINKGGSIAMAECFAWHSEHLPNTPDSAYDPRVISRIRPGGKIDAAAYHTLLKGREEIVAAFTAATAGFDALAWPTVPLTAPPMSAFTQDDDYHRLNGMMLRNPTVVNLADGCAISLPCPGAGAPVGLMLAAAHGQDDALLAFAQEVETLLAR